VRDARGKVWRWLAFGAGAALLAAAGVAAWQLQRLRARAPEEVVRVLSTAFDAQASVRDVGVHFTGGRLELKGIEVRSGERVLLQAAELRARPVLGALFRGRLQLAVSMPAAAVRLNAEDIQRIAHAEASKSVNALDVEDLRLAIELDRGNPQRVIELEHATLTASSGAGGQAFTLASSQGTWKSQRGRALAGALKLAGRRSAGEWRVDAEVSLGSGTLRVHAAGGANAVSFQLRPQHVDIASLRALADELGEPGTLQGALGGEIALKGTLSPLHLAGSLKLSAPQLAISAGGARTPDGLKHALALTPLTAAGAVTWSASELRFEPLRLGIGPNQLHGAAEVTDSTASIALRSDDFDLASLGPIWAVPIAGRGALQLSARSGPAEPAAAHAHVALAAAAIGGRDIGQLTADFSLDPATGKVTIERAEAESPERHVTTSGSQLQFGATGLESAQAKLELTRLPLRELYRLLGAADDPVLSQLQGSAVGTAELHFTASANGRIAPAGATDTSSLDVTLALQLANIDLAGYPLERGRVAARISIPDRTLGLRGGTLRLSELSLNAGGGTLSLSGSMLRGQLDMQLSARGLPLERAPWLRGRTFLSGRIDGRGTLHGDASNTLGDLQLGLDSLRLLGEPLGRIQLQALLRPANTAASATCNASRNALTTDAFHGSSAWLFCGGGWNDRLRVDLALGNGAARPIRGEVALSELALGPLLRGLQPSAAELAGTISATLGLTGGGLTNPERLSGRLRVAELSFGAGEDRLESTAPFELHARDGALALEAAHLSGPIQHYALAAAGSLGKTARLIADGQVAASTFTRDSEPVVKAYGDVGVHLEWTPGADETLRGRAELRDLALRGPASLQARHLRGALRLSGERLLLEGVEAEVGNGKVGITGYLRRGGMQITGYDLAIEAERIALEPEPLVRIELDLHAQLKWHDSASLPALNGQLMLRKLAYGKPIHLEALAAMNRTRPGVPNRDRLQLDLTVEQREPVRVRNMLLDGELTIAGVDRRLRIVGTDQRFGVLGELAVTRGRILFQGDHFHFTRGDIALNDPARVSPHFDVRAVADQPRRKDTSVVLTARGTRDAFKVAVQCEAGEAPVDAPPFTCNYAHDRMACDDFDRLVAQWSCPTKRTTKASTPAR
jgi:translocation and assembly module TamB